MKTYNTDKTVSIENLVQTCSDYRASAKSVVWTNGCFDVLHVGHVHLLSEASRLGDILVVGLNSDDSVRRLKGDGRPYYSFRDRARVLSAIAVVDYIIELDDDLPCSAIEQLKPEVCCKGSDYAPPGGKPIPEAKVISSYGGRLRYVQLLEGYSTSSILEQNNL